MTAPMNDRLRTNDASLTRLDISSTTLGEYSDWRKADFLNAVRYNETVTTVHLSGVNLDDCLSGNDIEELIDSIGCMNQLQGCRSFVTGIWAYAIRST